VTIAAGDLGALARALSAAHSDRAAVTGERSSLTFAQLDAAADAWADELLAAGHEPGARIGLLASNRPEWIAAAFGIWRAGCSLVPISTFVTARELADTLERGAVELLLLQSRFGSRDYTELLRGRSLPSRLRKVAMLGDGVPTLCGEARVSRPDSGPHPPIDPASVACVLHTSGTTARAKGVLLSHRAILATVGPTADRSGLDASDALLSTLPLFWVAGLIIRALPTLAAGCTLHLLESFTADAVLESLRRHRPTALHLRPPQVGQLLAHPKFDPELLRTVRKGNGRVEWFAPHLDPAATRFITGYGMTEMSGYVTALDWRDRMTAASGDVGTPLPGVAIRIVDENGRPCTTGQTGEIRVRGPGMFSGYADEDEATGIDVDGFLASGDLGHVDADGRLHFVGRFKDLLRVKGINVSPVEVEMVLASHPAVEAAHVVGLPADGLDQRVVALIVMRDGGDVPSDELHAFAAAELSHYKRPEHYIVIDRSEIPLGVTSKPQRSALAALAEELLRRAE
jgi:fatty-acyl-CoA synthase